MNPQLPVFDLDGIAIENEYYRRVVLTTSNTQLVLMSLLPNEEIGMEFQIFRLKSSASGRKPMTLIS